MLPGTDVGQAKPCFPPQGTADDDGRLYYLRRRRHD